MRTLTRWIWALVAAGAVALIPIWGLRHEHHAAAPTPDPSPVVTRAPDHTGAGTAGVVVVVLVAVVVAGLLAAVWVVSRRGVGRIVPAPVRARSAVRLALPPARPQRTLDEQLRDHVGG